MHRGALWTVTCVAERCGVRSIVQSRATARSDVATPETNAAFFLFLFFPSLLRSLEQNEKKPIATLT